MSFSVDNLYVLKYIGSKRRMVDVLAPFIPKTCTTYVEAYCGSAALALKTMDYGKNKCFSHIKRRILNDWNPHMANFWLVASTPELAPLLLKQLKETTYSFALFEEAKARREEYGANRDDLVEWAVDTYVLNWQSFNALGDNWRYVDSAPYDKHISDKTIGLPMILNVLCQQNIEVYNQDALDLLIDTNVLEDEKAFIFLDPPYLEGLRSKGKLYQTDMPNVRDHIELLNLIKTAKAKIVLSGYWSGRDDGTDLYDYYLLPHGWHRHLLGEYSKSCETGTDEKSDGAEWIWCNYDLSKEASGLLSGLASYNSEQKSPCLRAWLALQSTSPEGGERA